MGVQERFNWQWRRALVELVTIVLGISIALAADAMWDRHIDRQQERQALVRLLDDFTRSAELLEEAANRHRGQQAAVEHLLRLIAAAGDPPNSYQVPDSVLCNAYGTSRWIPPSGAVSSLVNSGEIRLITNDSLRAELTSWLDVVAAVQTIEQEERRHYEQFQLPLTYEYVPFVSIGFRTDGVGYESQSRANADYRALLNSLPFENSVEYRIAKKQQILTQYVLVSDQLQVVLALLERELGAT